MSGKENEAFLLEQQQAVERMREMSRRSLQQNPHHMPPTPSFVRLPENQTQATHPQSTSKPARSESTPHKRQQMSAPVHSPQSRPQSFLSGLLPNKFSIDSDTALILGLILLLSQENTDRMLLYALVYILL